MVLKIEQEHKSLLFRGEKFEYTLTQSKEESWIKSKKVEDKIKAEIIDNVQKGIKRFVKVWANGVDYEADCKSISEAVINHILG